MFTALWSFIGFKAGERTGESIGPWGFIGGVAIIIALFKWEDWFQPMFDTTGITSMLKRIGIVRDNPIETIITIFVIIPTLLMATVAALYVVTWIATKTLFPIAREIYHQAWFHGILSLLKWSLFLPLTVSTMFYLKNKNPEKYAYNQHVKKHNRIIRTSRKKALNNYMERYAHDPTLVLNEQELYDRIYRMYQSHIDAEILLAYDNNKDKLYFITNTVDLYPTDNLLKVSNEPYILGYPIAFDGYDVRKEKTAYVPSSINEDCLIELQCVQLPLSSIQKVRMLHRDEKRFQELAHYIRSGQLPKKETVYDFTTTKNEVYTATYEWLSSSEIYTIEKKVLLTMAQQGQLNDSLESYVYRRLSMMQAKDDDLALMMIEGQEMYYLLKYGHLIKPKPIIGIEELQQLPSVQSFLYHEIDFTTLLNQLVQEGYDTEQIFGKWMEWSA